MTKKTAVGIAFIVVLMMTFVLMIGFGEMQQALNPSVITFLTSDGDGVFEEGETPNPTIDYRDGAGNQRNLLSEITFIDGKLCNDRPRKTITGYSNLNIRGYLCSTDQTSDLCHYADWDTFRENIDANSLQYRYGHYMLDLMSKSEKHLGYEWTGETLPDCKLPVGNHEIEVIAYQRQGQIVVGKTSVKTEIFVKPLPCVLDDNQVLVGETFSADAKISKDTLRYDPVKFCGEHAPLVVNAFTKSSYNDYDILEKLRSGETYIVPSTKVVSVFYVAKNDGTLPLVCSSGELLNINDQMCQDAIGFATVCSEGQFDPATGVCVVQPESKVVCPDGGRYDVAQGLCIKNADVEIECELGQYDESIDACVYNPDVDTVCPQGQWNSETETCIVNPDLDYVCLNGELKNVDGEQVCEVAGQTKIVCPLGFTLKDGVCLQEGITKTQWIWVGVLILIGTAILFGGYFALKGKNKRR